MKLSDKARQTMEQATQQYQNDIPLIKDYLLGRGIDGKTAQAARLGYVRRPIIGHESYQGRLAIPYITPSGVTDIRFRCLENHDCKTLDHPKYLSQPGHDTKLYGTTSIMTAGNAIAIAEGELDALILRYRCGIPAVGVAGVQTWKSFYPRIFADFDTIYLFADADQAGREFAKKLLRELSDVTDIHLPLGYDVTDYFIEEGAEGIRSLAGLEEQPA